MPCRRKTAYDANAGFYIQTERYEDRWGGILSARRIDALLGAARSDKRTWLLFRRVSKKIGIPEPPPKFGNVYDEISLIRAKNHGRLSVLYEKKEQLLDLTGVFFCAVLRKGEKTTVVFSPEMDLDEIENILLIKQILKEESKK